MKIVNLLLAFFTVVITIALFEVGLRVTGHQPGIFRYYDEYKIVDSLRLYKDFVMSKEGIYRHGPIVVDSIQLMWMDRSKDEHPDIDRFAKKIKYDVTELFLCYDTLLAGCNHSATNSEFEQFACDLFKRSQPRPETVFDSLYLAYLRRPLNEEGLRTIPFKPVTTDRPKIMLIGDSFTWGESAIPLYNSFADRLAARGYLVYNMGIAGTDPVQYYATAKKYIPLLQPDVVIVNFYTGNDLIYRKRPLHEEFEYVTNAGDFFADPAGKHLSPQEAYEFYKQLFFIPETTFFNRLCSQTVITSLFWGILYEWDKVQHPPNKRYKKYPHTENPVSEFYIEKIKRIAKKHESLWMLSIIPSCCDDEKGQRVKLSPALLKQTFEKLNYHVPQNLTINDYVEDQSHFDNIGHKKYADFLQRKIDSLLQTESNSR